VLSIQEKVLVFILLRKFPLVNRTAFSGNFKKEKHSIS